MKPTITLASHFSNRSGLSHQASADVAGVTVDAPPASTPKEASDLLWRRLRDVREAIEELFDDGDAWEALDKQ